MGLVVLILTILASIHEQLGHVGGCKIFTTYLNFFGGAVCGRTLNVLRARVTHVSG